MNRLLLSTVGALGGALGLTALGHAIAVAWPSVLVVATPAAPVVAWFTGWGLQREGGMMSYVVGYYLTTLMVGAVMGGTFAHQATAPR